MSKSIYKCTHRVNWINDARRTDILNTFVTIVDKMM